MINIINIAKEIKARGGTCFYVGGYVRASHFLRGGTTCEYGNFSPNEQQLEKIGDIDIEVFGLEPKDLRTILQKFGKVKLCGKHFGVFKLDNIDFSLPRKEIKTGEKHTDFDIEVDPYLSYELACKRRDFTMNAIMMNVLTCELVDPYNGTKDMHARVIKHVNDETFKEDPLRILRAAQFSARFGFTISDETTELCESIVHKLIYIPKERIFEEFNKILLSPKPSIGFNWLLKIKALNIILPELSLLKHITENIIHHPEGNTFDHTMLVVDEAILKDLNYSYALLFHDIGKLICHKADEDNIVTNKYHARVGAEILPNIIKHRLTDDVDLIKKVCSLIKHHMDPFNFRNKPTKRLIRRLASRVDFTTIMAVYYADKLGRGNNDLNKSMKMVEFYTNALSIYEEIKNEVAPIIKGRHLIELGLKPSPKFGEILKAVYEKQLDGEFNNIDSGKMCLEDYLQENDCDKRTINQSNF